MQFNPVSITYNVHKLNKYVQLLKESGKGILHWFEHYKRINNLHYVHWRLSIGQHVHKGDREKSAFDYAVR